MLFQILSISNTFQKHFEHITVLSIMLCSHLYTTQSVEAHQYQAIITGKTEFPVSEQYTGPILEVSFFESSENNIDELKNFNFSDVNIS